MLFSQLRSRFALLVSTPALALILSGCGQTTQVKNLEGPAPDIETTMTIQDQKYKPISDQLLSLEKMLQKFSEKSVRVRRIGGSATNIHTIKDKDISIVSELQTELNKTHQAILTFLSNPLLNPGSRFAPGGIEVSGSIGDVERSLASIIDMGGDGLEWIASADIMEELRRLHHELQAFRADIAGASAVIPKLGNAHEAASLRQEP